MVNYLTLEFPEFITHAQINHPKLKTTKVKFSKIAYNTIHGSAHHTLRSAIIEDMHKYLLKNIPNDLCIQTPIETKLVIYVPINYGDVKLLTRKLTGERYLSWKKPALDYEARWDIGNLAFLWLKCLDDVLKKKGIIPDDNIMFVRGGAYEFRLVDSIEERKLVYKLRTKKLNKWDIESQ